MDALEELKKQVEEMLEIDGSGYDDHFDVHAYQMGIEAVLEKLRKHAIRTRLGIKLKTGFLKKMANIL